MAPQTQQQQQRPQQGRSNNNQGQPSQQGRQIQPINAIDAPLASAVNLGWDKIQAAMGALVKPETVINVLGIIAYKTPQIRECVPVTIVNAIVRAATLGLDLHPDKGEAWLIPRWNKHLGSGNFTANGVEIKGALECQFQPGYKGIIKLWKASGEVRTAQCRLVYDTDFWMPPEYGSHTGDEPFLWKHIPDYEAPGEKDRVICAYCYVVTTSGEKLITVLNRRQIEASRARGKASGGAWESDWEAMAARTPITPMKRFLTLNDKLIDAFRAMQEPDDDGPVDTTATVTTATGPALGSAGLQRRLGQSPPQATVTVAEKANGTQETTTTNGGAAPVDVKGEVTTASEPVQGQSSGESFDEFEQPPAPAVKFEDWLNTEIARWQTWWTEEGSPKGVPLDVQHRVLADYNTVVNGTATDAVKLGLLDESYIMRSRSTTDATLVRSRSHTIAAVKWLYEEQPAALADIIAAHCRHKAERWHAELLEIEAKKPKQSPEKAESKAATKAAEQPVETVATTQPAAVETKPGPSPAPKQTVRPPHPGTRQAESLLPDPDDDSLQASNPADG